LTNVYNLYAHRCYIPEPRDTVIRVRHSTHPDDENEKNFDDDDNYDDNGDGINNNNPYEH